MYDEIDDDNGRDDVIKILRIVLPGSDPTILTFSHHSDFLYVRDKSAKLRRRTVLVVVTVAAVLLRA